MDIGAIVSRARKAAADNTPTILTALGVTGAITTAVLASKASFKAAEILHEIDMEVDEEHGGTHHREANSLDTRTKFEKTWKLYIPAATTGVVTVACIITANRVSSRRAAALASAYSISQEAFREYKSKVFEKLGEKKEQTIRDDIAKDRVKNIDTTPFILVDSEVLCLDTHSGRLFKSDRETIRRAVNDINWQLLNEDRASLTDFWDLIGLPPTADSDEIGWIVDANKPFDVRFASALAEDGKPVLTIEFDTGPIRSYYKNH